jgi:hypothetical protein
MPCLIDNRLFLEFQPVMTTRLDMRPLADDHIDDRCYSDLMDRLCPPSGDDVRQHMAFETNDDIFQCKLLFL